MKGITTQEGRETLNKFKMEAANEVGVNLKQGYNGDLTPKPQCRFLSKTEN